MARTWLNVKTRVGTLSLLPVEGSSNIPKSGTVVNGRKVLYLRGLFHLFTFVVQYGAMNTRTQEEATAPLGVIGSLTTGFEMVGRHIWLIALPMLLDMLLWLGPRLSPLPLMQRFADFLMAQPLPDPQTAEQAGMMVELLDQFGDRFNLFSLLSSLPMLNVPSLLARHAPALVSPLGEPEVVLIRGVLVLVAWTIVLMPFGLALGFLYLNGLASRVRTMRAPEGPNAGPGDFEGAQERSPVTRFLIKLVNVFLFATVLLIVGMIVVPLWSLAVGAIMLVAPPFGFLAWVIGTGLGGYLVLHLLFVLPGVLVGERGLFRAILESFLMIQMQFPSVVGLILAVLVIYEGLGFVWSLPSGDSWALLVGILGNGCIATGLTSARFIFYPERVGQLPELRRASAKTE
jgi:hypothetical protein